MERLKIFENRVYWAILGRAEEVFVTTLRGWHLEAPMETIQTKDVLIRDLKTMEIQRDQKHVDKY